MGPHRVIHNRRGYLTETCYDDISGRFIERPFPPKPKTSSPVAIEVTTLLAPKINDEDLSQLNVSSPGKPKRQCTET